MAGETLFCPHCGARQLKPDARYCHVCGQPIPVAPARADEPAAPAPKRPRQLSTWWLLPLLLVGIVVLVLLAWEPARSRVAGLLAGFRPAATEPASGGRGGASERAAPGETASASPSMTFTTKSAVAPTATPRPTATPQPTATPPPTATLAPTATPPPRATLLPSPTPKAPLPAASGQSLTVSLQAVANAGTTDGYVDPPVGDVVLGGMRFSLGRGGSVTTQASPLPDNPKSISLPVDAQAPQAVYLLLTGGDLFSRFAGQTVGRVRLVFADGKAHAVDLVAGQNLREWKHSADVISRATSPELTEVWRGANRFDAGPAVIDMLKIAVPPELQSGRLVSVEVLDLSAETAGDLDPALNVLGLSVALKPAPTAVPTISPCRIAAGDKFRALWQQQRARLGCALNKPAQSDAATERFQRGRMIWRKSNDMIYVLYDDGDWAAFPDISVDGAPEPEGFQAPAGLYTPVRGFGATWRAELGGTSARIGWATQDEYGVSVQFQDFEKGMMLEMEDKVYLLGDNGRRWLAP
jgi:hypothetical protein